MKTFFSIVTLGVLLLLMGATHIPTLPFHEAEVLMKNGDVPFIEAKNYFLKNTYKPGDLKNPKITSQASFDALFGMATTMGEAGKPTIIDFSKQYVIAIIVPETNKATTLAVSSLKQAGKNITCTYTHTEGETLGYTLQPILLLVVDKKYDGKVKLQKSK